MRKKKNGCSGPLHPRQILAWVTVFLNTSEFVLVSWFIPSVSDRWLMIGLCGTTVIVALYYGVLVTLSQPDAHSLKLNQVGKAETFDLDIVEYPLVCYSCEACIKRTTKHCMACNKCIERFDHHCKWVNNCIGQRNYHSFVKLLLSTAAEFVVFFGANCVVLAQYLAETSEFLEESESLLGISGFLVFGLALVFALEEALVIISLLYLLGFHLYLKISGLTTFEYITQKRRSELSVAPRDLQGNSTHLKIHELDLDK